MMSQPISRRGFGIAAILPFGRSRTTLCSIPFRRIRNGSSNRRFLLIHGDEATARNAIVEHLKSNKGTAFLVENETRDVPFRGGYLNPNRMFSALGADRDLRRLNPNAPEPWILSALVDLDNHRHEILNELMPPGGGIIIALHNNLEGYSLQSEAGISDAVALNDSEHASDFFLCTSPSDFDVLRGGAYNVLLQYRKPVEDDGSLSRFAAKNGIRYLNIEAKLGAFDKQRDMLGWAEKVLP